MNQLDAAEYNRVALGANAPVYDYYAGRILEKTGIDRGCCLDLGCGGGYLGLALARITSLTFVFLDSSPSMLGWAVRNIASQGVGGRAVTLLGRVQAIPLSDRSVDLVVSRGSVPFWDDLATAFREVKRVLRPGGRAYIGGGLGDPKTRQAHLERLRKEHPEWQARGRGIPRHGDGHYTEALEAAGVRRFNLTRSDEGMWIQIWKEGE